MLPSMAAIIDLNKPKVLNAKTVQTKKIKAKLKPSELVKQIYNSIDVSNIKRDNTCKRMSVKNRNVIMKLISIAENNSKINFEKTEIIILLQIYLQITGEQDRDITSDELKAFLYATLDITNPFALDGICKAAIQPNRQSTQRKSINPIDFLILMSILLRGSINDRAELAFRVMDIDGDGQLRKNIEFRCLLFDSFDAKIAALNPEIDPEEPIRDIVNFLCDKFDCTVSHPLSIEKFKKLSLKSPWVIELLLPCLPSEQINIMFQSLFNTRVILPSLELVPIFDKQIKN